MPEAFQIGLNLALKDGVSSVIEPIRLDLASLEAALAGSGVNLQDLCRLATAPASSTQRVGFDRSAPSAQAADENGPTQSEAITGQANKRSDQKIGAQPVVTSPLAHTPHDLILTSASATRAKQPVVPVKAEQVVVAMLGSSSATSVGLPSNIASASSVQFPSRGLPTDVDLTAPSTTHLMPSITPPPNVMYGEDQSKASLIARQFPQPESLSLLSTSKAVNDEWLTVAPPALPNNDAMPSSEVDIQHPETGSELFNGGDAAGPWRAAPVSSQPLWLMYSAVSTSSPMLTSPAATQREFSNAIGIQPLAPTFMRDGGTGQSESLSVANGKNSRPQVNWLAAQVGSLEPSHSTHEDGGAPLSAEQTKVDRPFSGAGRQPQDGRPVGGDVFFDGALVGRWISRLLSKEAERASIGPTGFDIRRSRLMSGPSVGA